MSNRRTMRRHLACLSVLAIAASVSAAAAAGGPSEPTTSRTTVAGEPPVDLVGTWLMVGSGRFVLGAQSTPSTPERFRTAVEIWTVEGSPSGLEVALLDRQLPGRVQAALDTANRELRAWTPSADDVAAIRTGLDHLPRNDPDRFLRHTYHLVDSAHLIDLAGFPSDLTAGLQLGLEVEHEYRPQPIDTAHPGAQLMRDRAVYAVRDTGAVLAGEHVRTVLAAGFVPIPITTRGPFHLYRLRAPGDEAPAPEVRAGLGAQLAAALRGLLRGCR